MIINCKMCGGQIEVSEDMTIAKCRYCGSTMTIPRIESEKKARLFNRANQYRLNNEFDKAYDAYKSIVDEDEQEAEGYWGMLLAEYGVEYVEDPKTGKRVPTCHRTKLQSILDTSNYNLACKYADVESRFMYQDEAEVIDSIQKQIIAVTAKEEPYDVFICYKETDDESGARTDDSVLAYDIYESLEKRGIRTFFSRVTLEDKLGRDYEPYIYAALRSARVLLLVTTKASYVQAVWVKNEWKRYLAFMEEDRNKVLIPVYKGISPYELPGELSRFQSLDIGKIGANQDLIRAIEKTLGQKKSEHRDDRLINELVAANAKRDTTRRKVLRICGAGAIVLFSILPTILPYLFNFIVWSNGDYNYTAKGFLSRFSNVSRIMLCASVIMVLCGAFLSISILKGKLLGISTILFDIGVLLFAFGVYGVSTFTFRPSFFIIFPLILSITIMFSISGIFFHKRRFIQAIIPIIASIGAIVICYVTLNRTIPYASNEENIYTDQLTISTNHVDIKEQPDKTSRKIGEVYSGDYYYIINVFEKEEKWFEIETNSKLHGFISGKGIEFVRNIEDKTVSAFERGDINEGFRLLDQIDVQKMDQGFLDRFNKAICLYVWNEVLDGRRSSLDDVIERYYSSPLGADGGELALIQGWEESASDAEIEVKNKADYNKALYRANDCKHFFISELIEALTIMEKLAEEGYSDSNEKLNEICQSIYSYADELYLNKDYYRASELYAALSRYNYLDSAALVKKCDEMDQKETEERKEEYQQEKKKKWELQYNEISKINGLWKSEYGETLRFKVDITDPFMITFTDAFGDSKKKSFMYDENSCEYIFGMGDSLVMSEDGKTITGGISIWHGKFIKISN